MNTEDVEAAAGPFLRNWLLVCVVIVVLVAICNVVADPYLAFGTPRIDRINARKPAVDKHQRAMKAYDVVRARPRTLILGELTRRGGAGFD